MKRLVLLIAVILVAIGLQAQDYTANIGITSTFVAKTLNHTLTHTDTVDMEVDVSTHHKITIDVLAYCDSVSGDPSGTLYLEGRKSDDLGWSAIANTAWSGADGTVVVSHTTAVRYRELRLRYISGGTGVVDVDKYWTKIWYE